MPISDAQYAAWLAADNEDRCVLLEVDAYSGGSVVTRYASNRGYVSSPSASPANTAYDEILTGLPGITQRMSEVLAGRTTVSYGDIEIDNSGGVRDSWLLDAWDGRAARLYLGDPSWDRADFRPSFVGVIQDVTAPRSGVLALKLRDRQYLFDVPLQVNRVTGGTNINAKLPACYGQVLNVTPTLIDAPTRKYAVHDGQIEAVDAAYMDGAALAGSAYTADLSAGTVTMNVAVTGRLTFDVRGSKTGGVYVSTTGDIMRRIAMERAGLVSGDVGSLTAINTDAPGIVGVYFRDDATTVRDALDRLAVGAGAYYTFDRAGVLQIGLFKAPAGTPAVTLIDEDIEQGQLTLLRRYLPAKSVRVGYARNHTVMQSSIAASVTEAARERLGNEYLIERATNTVTGYLLAEDEDMAGSCYALQATAATEATRRAALRASLRQVFRARAFLAAGAVRLGDVVSVDFSRYGLGGGVLCNLVGLRESLTGGWQELELWR